MLTSAALLVSFFSLSYAQQPFVYTIGVGIDQTTGQSGVGFDPSFTNPAVGDIVTFEIRDGNHQVVESTFDNPCTPVSGGEFDTGPQTVAAGTTAGFPQFNYTVTRNSSIWFYDAVLCEQGAVFALNPPVTGNQTFDAFKARALALGGNVTTTLAPTSSSTTSTPTTTSSSSNLTSTTSSASPKATTSTAKSGASRLEKVGSAGLTILVGLMVKALAA